MSYSFGLEPGWGRLRKADDYVLLRTERIVNLLLSLGRDSDTGNQYVAAGA
jgi:hypothetical protein